MSEARGCTGHIFIVQKKQGRGLQSKPRSVLQQPRRRTKAIQNGNAQSQQPAKLSLSLSQSVSLPTSSFISSSLISMQTFAPPNAPFLKPSPRLHLHPHSSISDSHSPFSPFLSLPSTPFLSHSAGSLSPPGVVELKHILQRGNPWEWCERRRGWWVCLCDIGVSLSGCAG